ncbi:MAG: MetQ/NlpA family ABC transporter substrate-binding protein [Bacillota bacterium]|nr:MetQ/NlpA family ABC transporter substrate-binding protein [Bacillota bacterium]
MKKQLLLIPVLVLTLLFGLTACGGDKAKEETKTDEKQTEQGKEAENKEGEKQDAKDGLEPIKVGATPLPHAEILEIVKDDLAAKGYELEIVEFTDYVMPNMALDEGSIDANFFQHEPYMDTFAKDHDLKLVNAGGVHVEPMGVYSNKIKSIEELKDGDKVAIPNDSTNGGRALLLLEKHGLIKLNDEAGLEATEIDITENKLNLKFSAIDAAQLPRTLDDVTISVINSNYALEAGFNPVKDSLVMEEKDSPYVNIITVLEKNAESEKTKALVEVLQTEKVKKFIEEKYEGSIVPSF